VITVRKRHGWTDDMQAHNRAIALHRPALMMKPVASSATSLILTGLVAKNIYALFMFTVKCEYGSFPLRRYKFALCGRNDILFGRSESYLVWLSFV